MKIAGLVLLVLAPILSFGQIDIPIGTWRTHFSYNSAKRIALAGNQVYVASDRGLFIFDKEDNSITTISKIDGLSEDNVAALAYDELTQQLIIGYNSGNIDVLQKDKIININLVDNSQVIGSKRINHVLVQEGYTFVATDYGLLNVDLQKLEVKEIYRQLGEGAIQIKVNQSAILNDSIYLATEMGVIASNFKNGVNLFDASNWTRYTAIKDKNIAGLASFDDNVVAAIDQNGLFQLKNNWQPIVNLPNASFSFISDSGGLLLYITNEGVFVLATLESPNPTIISDELMVSANQIFSDGKSFWVADETNGLVTNYQNQYQSIMPNGPVSNTTFRLYYAEGNLNTIPGGFTPTGQPSNLNETISLFNNGQWQALNENNVFRDFTDAVFDPATQSYYYTSFGNGLLKIDMDGNKVVFDETNSTLQQTETEPPGINLTSVTSSTEGIWVTNYGASQPLHLYTNNQWQSFSLAISSLLDVVNTNRFLWFVIDPSAGGGILLFDKQTQTTRILNNQNNNGGLPSNIVNSVAVDKDGLVWVGTNAGVAVLQPTSDLINANINAILPIFENRQLLRDQQVTVITIDQGNRKWMGTNNGVWLFDEDINEQLLYFNVDNSPLIANSIKDIAIHNRTGEVFFALPDGVMSYRGTATVARADDEIKIFPNPVPIDFTGTIGISGLAQNVEVKITDARGQLIWQTTSAGGTATWNAMDYTGKRAATGVYFVFAASKDGENSLIGKIAIVN